MTYGSYLHSKLQYDKTYQASEQAKEKYQLKEAEDQQLSTARLRWIPMSTPPYAVPIA
jgi:hypothetical protein